MNNIIEGIHVFCPPVDGIYEGEKVGKVLVVNKNLALVEIPMPGRHKKIAFEINKLRRCWDKEEIQTK